MRDRVNVSVFFFMIIGGVEGLFLSLIPAFLLDYLCEEIAVISSISYIQWLAMLAPIFFALGVIINGASSILLVDDDAEKPKRRKVGRPKKKK